MTFAVRRMNLVVNNFLFAILLFAQLLLLDAAISGGILMDRNNITLWTEFEDILHKYSEDQDEQDPQIPLPYDFQSQVDSSKDPLGYIQLKADVIKRGSHYHQANGCDCKVKTDMIDLGKGHFPRYLTNAVCEDNRETLNGICSHGSKCKPIEYRVNVLAIKRRNKRFDRVERNQQVPDRLRAHFQFNEITVVAGCICSQL